LKAIDLPGACDYLPEGAVRVGRLVENAARVTYRKRRFIVNNDNVNNGLPQQL
jgi:hypothetical protein